MECFARTRRGGAEGQQRHLTVSPLDVVFLYAAASGFSCFVSLPRTFHYFHVIELQHRVLARNTHVSCHGAA
ncbi:unnamed protein product [Urochloa humidicola]